MIGSKFWEAIGAGTAQKWKDRLLSPALVFWAVGLVAHISANGWAPIASWLQGLDQWVLISVVVGGLMVVAGTEVAVEDLQAVGLRFLEGYWPRPLRPLRRHLVKRTHLRIEKIQAQWASLAERYDNLSPEEIEIYSQLDGILATYPSHKRVLPTRLGNILRAAEDYAWERYRLATGVLWPRLWLVMPERTQGEIAEARKRLNTGTRMVIWSTILLVWAIWAWWWVIPVAIAGAFWGYWRTLKAAGVYGELLRAAFDLYRGSLYESMRTGLPSNPAEELQTGSRLTDYLWRGSHDTIPAFTSDKA